VLGAWLYMWSWFPALGLVVLLPMVFPTGHAVGPRWRHVLRAEVGSIAVFAALWMVNPGPMNDPGKPLYPDNPIGVARLGPIYGPLDTISSLLVVVFLVVSAIAAGVRFRRARSDERQQLKWMTYGIATWIV